MDIAKQFAAIDPLRGRSFPRSGAAREETRAQFEAERDGPGERLAERWGRPE
ncbi:hypothetical protein [Streptomyces sp. NPDC047000]|uniref:hypothetical protein n=1 Tax=Streptomyces sp. NPDC047000 TaxID=3155474 RepID=UPI0033DD2B97